MNLNERWWMRYQIEKTDNATYNLRGKEKDLRLLQVMLLFIQNVI